MDRDAALEDIDRTLAIGRQHTLIDEEATHEEDRMEQIAAVALYHACILRYAPPGSTYRTLAERHFGTPNPKANRRPDLDLRGVLMALRADVERDKLFQFEELVRADIYSDLLAQADGLHRDRYSRAAVVVAGAALEEHIKKLAIKHGTGISRDDGEPKKASIMNSELKKAGVYAEVQRATVESWQKLRNDAAHGDPGFEPPDASLVASVAPMIQGVRGFIATHPA